MATDEEIVNKTINEEVTCKCGHADFDHDNDEGCCAVNSKGVSECQCKLSDFEVRLYHAIKEARADERENLITEKERIDIFQKGRKQGAKEERDRLIGERENKNQVLAKAADEAFEKGKQSVKCSCGDGIEASKCKKTPTVCEMHLEIMCKNERQAGREEQLIEDSKKTLPDFWKTIESQKKKIVSLEGQLKELNNSNGADYQRKIASLEKELAEKDKTLDRMILISSCPKCGTKISNNRGFDVDNENARLRDALKHQTERNHDYKPNSCSGCEKAKQALEEGK